METLNAQELAYIASMELIHEYQGNFPVQQEIAPITQFFSKKTDILVFGKPKNWKDDFKNHPELLSFLYERNINTIYTPNPSNFNGTIINSYDFEEIREIGGFKIMGGRMTEGLILPPRSGTLMCTADCPTIIYHDIINDIVVVAHAGFRSIVDKQKIMIGIPSRYNKSVVDDIMDKVPKTDDYRIHIVCGIHYGSFRYNPEHPIYGEFNAKMLNYLLETYGETSVPFGFKHGGISILNIIKKQFIGYGLDADRIISDDINTHDDQRFWSHSRSKKHGETQSGRNGVLVLHKE